MNQTLVIIPAHNEAQSIGTVLERLRTTVPLADRLVVNDGSTDGTSQLVISLGERCLDIVCNIGYGPALQAGLAYALQRGYQTAVFLDADGQHDPADVPRLVAALDELDCDMVIGSRYVGGRPYAGPRTRRIGQRLFSWLTRAATGRRIYDTTSGLKAVRARVFRALVEGTFMDFHTEALIELSMRGYDVREVPISMHERKHGRSMHSWKSHFEYPLKTMVLTLVAVVNVLLPRRPL